MFDIKNLPLYLDKVFSFLVNICYEMIMGTIMADDTVYT